MGIGHKEKGFYFKSNDGKEIYIHQWNDIANPKAVIQIFHGMAEHAGRYQRFAEFLNDNGFLVYADDHRGHGKTAGSVEEVGYIGEDGFNRIIDDERLLTELIKERHPGLPVFVFAHSFGTFIGQAYITLYGKDIDGIILSGSAARNQIEIIFGRVLTTIERVFTGERKKSLLLNAVCFGTYNKKITNLVSPFAWLSRDEEEVRKYEADEFCGAVFTVNFFYYLFKGFADLYRKGNFNKISQNLPVYIMSGAEDPVGGLHKKC